MQENNVDVIFDAISENESFARVVAAAFVTRLDPTLEEISDIKTAVSEAVTNSIVHGYEGKGGKVYMTLSLEDREIIIRIKDEGVGIENVHKAMEPLYTTKPELERSGMGFSFMEAFMDELNVYSRKNVGTTVIMKKRISIPGRGLPNHLRPHPPGSGTGLAQIAIHRRPYYNVTPNSIYFL